MTHGPKKKAKTLSAAQIVECFERAKMTSTPKRDAVILHLSFGLGLRSCEMARLEWKRHLLDARGSLNQVCIVSGDIAKNGRERHLMMTQPIREALMALFHEQRGAHAKVVHSPYAHRTDGLSPNALAQWFKRFYADADLEGCSSHSGRRTFITSAARNVHKIGGSLADVQRLAGHSSITTTEGYIDTLPVDMAIMNVAMMGT